MTCVENTYDDLGRVKSSKRHGNKGFEFKDTVKQDNEYTYDKNGNMTKNLNKDITEIQYNYLNSPNKVTFKEGNGSYARKIYSPYPYMYHLNNPIRLVDPTGIIPRDYRIGSNGNIRTIGQSDDKPDRLIGTNQSIGKDESITVNDKSIYKRQ